MRQFAKEGNRKFPVEALCLTWNAENFLGVTPLLKFYLNIGIKITKIHYAVNYTRGRPFKKFVDDMVAVRVAAVGKNDPLGQRAKFTLNSMAGRFGMNLERHRQCSFVHEKDLASFGLIINMTFIYY